MQMVVWCGGVVCGGPWNEGLWGGGGGGGEGAGVGKEGGEIGR